MPIWLTHWEVGRGASRPTALRWPVEAGRTWTPARPAGGRRVDGRDAERAGRQGGGPYGEQGQGTAEGGGAAHGTPWDAGPDLDRSGRSGHPIDSSMIMP